MPLLRISERFILFTLIGLLCVSAQGALLPIPTFTETHKVISSPDPPVLPDVDPPFEQGDFWQSGRPPGAFSLPQFDPSPNRQLLQVTLTIDGDIWGGGHFMQNDSPNLGRNCWVRIKPTVHVWSASPASALNENFQPDVITHGELIPFAGPLAAPIVGGNWFTDVDQKTGPPFGTDNLSNFIGTGDIDFTFDSTLQSSEFHSVSPVITWSEPPGFRFEAEVVYEWVPEPASLAFLGLGALALLKRRRKKPL